jgi:two-component system nitrate/nitrite response regulator NarL
MADRLLVVDDHAGFRRLARLVMQRGGFDVIAEAANGAEAVMFARTLVPDVVLLDILLPDLNGFAVAERLCRLPHPPVVVLTSSRPATDFGARIADAPVKGFLAKDELTAQRLADIAAAERSS